MLWQHLFWFFGHPEVYIIALPFFGIITEILPVFSRKPIFGYKGLVVRDASPSRALSVTVWAHHMYVTGAVLLPFFAVHDVPHRRAHRGEVLQLDRHDVAGLAHVRDADAVGDRLPRHVPVRRPDRRHPGRRRRWTSRSPTPTSSSPTSTTSCSAPSCSRCSPASTSGGRRSPAGCSTSGSARSTSGLLFIGFHTTFLVQHWLGVEGMPRRYADYLPDGRLHHAEHGLDRRLVPARRVDAAVPLQRLADRGTAPKVTVDDPWGYGGSLEWATSCPPPRHNFTSLPRIRSERPAFDLHHPEVAMATRQDADRPTRGLLGQRCGDAPTCEGAAVKIEGWLFTARARSSSLVIDAGLLVSLRGPDRHDRSRLSPSAWPSSIGVLPALHRPPDRPAARGPNPTARSRRAPASSGFFSPHSLVAAGLRRSAAVSSSAWSFGWWLFIIGSRSAQSPWSAWSSSTTGASTRTDLATRCVPRRNRRPRKRGGNDDGLRTVH